MAPIAIRCARDEELPVLVAAFGQEHYFRDRLDRQARGLGHLVVAWRDGVAIGNVYLVREEPLEPEVQRHLGRTPTLNHLEVAPAHQGRGVGTALVAEVERMAGELGYPRLGLGCGLDNPGALRLYERLGYRDWGHGPVDVEWDEPDERGLLEHHRLVCTWLVKPMRTAAPGLDAWRAFEPREAAAVFARAGLDDVPWYVAGGWAVDLHLGRHTRAHEDLEVAIPRPCLPRWRAALDGYDFYDVGAGRIVPLARDGQPEPANHQLWLAEDGVWRLDTFLEAGDAATWVSHRDARVRAPLSTAVVRDADGIPYLRPQFVLLSKAKYRRAKDEADFEALVPTMDIAARRWLAGALSTVHPQHPWIWRVIKGAAPIGG